MKINYFEKEAYLAQSPQLYKQILTGVFERVFEIGTVFRAEPHFTTRHINEYTGLDAEMGMINDFNDVMIMLNAVLKRIFDGIKKQGFGCVHGGRHGPGEFTGDLVDHFVEPEIT